MDSPAPTGWPTWLGFGLAVAAVLGYLAVALSYPRGTLARPGPGLFPTVVGGVLLAGLVALAAQRWRAPARAEPAEEATDAADGPRDARARLRAAALIALLLGYVLLLPFIGDLAGSALLVFAVLLLMRQRVWWAALYAVAVALAVHYLFVVFLALPLTSGSGLW